MHILTCNYNLHIDSLLSRAPIVDCTCTFLEYARIMGTLNVSLVNSIFDSLIILLFLYELEVWGSEYQGKYLDRMDAFFRRAYRFDYTHKISLISDEIKNRDSKLLNRITGDTGHVLYDLLPPNVIQGSYAFLD